MPAGIRQQKDQWRREILAFLRESFEVVDGGLVDTAASAGESAGRLAAENIDALLLIPMMAVKAEVGVASSRLIDASLVVWNAHESSSLPSGYDAAALVGHSGNVGTLALTNALLREGRRFLLTTSHWQDRRARAQLVEQLSSACVATSLSRIRLATIGGPFPGMLDIGLDDDVLRSCGLNPAEPVPVSLVREEFARVPDDALSAEVISMKATFSCGGLSDDALRRSARLALALEELTQSRGLDGGAVNCHCAGWREDPKLGVLGCYAVSRLTSRGVPFACTGDMCTGLAMVIANRLSGTAFYCEVDLLDYQNGEALLSNSGEMDYRYSAAGKEELAPHSFYHAAAGVSAVASGTVRPGPATLLALTPVASGRLRLIAAPGEVVDRKAKDLPVSNCVFKFDRAPVSRAFDEWCAAGANHHAALMEGRRVESLRRIAELRSWELIAVEETGGPS